MEFHFCTHSESTYTILDLRTIEKGWVMFVNVIVHVRTPQGDNQAGVEGFSRVPSIGESIQVPQGIFRVIDVTHFSNRGLSSNHPVASILIKS